jgi:hypothetical protein
MEKGLVLGVRCRTRHYYPDGGGQRINLNCSFSGTYLVTVGANHFVSTCFCDVACLVNFVDVSVVIGVKFSREVLTFDDIFYAVVVKIIHRPFILSLVEGLDAVSLTNVGQCSPNISEARLFVHY